MKRYPTSKVRETQVRMVSATRGHQRADTLKPYSQKTSQSNHTRTTAFSNSVKLSHARGATQDEWVMLEVMKGGGEEISFVQGKEQWLRFAGAAVKRYPMSKVRETQVRW